MSAADSPGVRICFISSRVKRPLGTLSSSDRRSSACWPLDAAMMIMLPLGGSMRPSAEPGGSERPAVVSRNGSSRQASMMMSEKRARLFRSSTSCSSDRPSRTMARSLVTLMSTGSRKGPVCGGCEPWPEKKNTTSSPFSMRRRKPSIDSLSVSRLASSTRVTAKPALSNSRASAVASLRALRSLVTCW